MDLNRNKSKVSLGKIMRTTIDFSETGYFDQWIIFTIRTI